MEKLELKHLAPYLPYNTMVWYDEDLDLAELLETYIEKHTIPLNPYNMDSCVDGRCKLVLSPLSDLRKHLPEHEEIMDEFSDCSWELFEDTFFSRIRPENWSDFINYSVAQMLFKYHFDLFGLIEKGLAIDINTLPCQI